MSDTPPKLPETHPEQAVDDARRGIVLVQRVCQLLPRRVQRLPQRVRLQHERVPLLQREGRCERVQGTGR